LIVGNRHKRIIKRTNAASWVKCYRAVAASGSTGIAIEDFMEEAMMKTAKIAGKNGAHIIESKC